MPAHLIRRAVSAQNALICAHIVAHIDVGRTADSHPACSLKACLKSPAVERGGNIAYGKRVVRLVFQHQAGMETQRLGRRIDQASRADRLPGEPVCVLSMRNEPCRSPDGKGLTGRVLGNHRCRAIVGRRFRCRCRRGCGNRRRRRRYHKRLICSCRSAVQREAHLGAVGEIAVRIVFVIRIRDRISRVIPAAGEGLTRSIVKHGTGGKGSVSKHSVLKVECAQRIAILCRTYFIQILTDIVGCP